MVGKARIRIVVVDDQAIVRTGLIAFLQADRNFELIGEAKDGEEALQLCNLVEPDIVLMDLDMPVLDGISSTAIIKQQLPKTKVLMLSSHNEDEFIQAAFEAGVSGYLLKDVSETELAKAIHQIIEEDQIITPHSQEKDPERKLKEMAGLSGLSLAQEVATAGQIQAELLPLNPPRLNGWDISATLEPARVASGDFFDFIPLANNNWGIMIADVSDKGIGAALFMALCSTLIRTYAIEYATVPALALNHVNDRILSDSRSEMFVTVFYGVLEPDTGRLRYVNAGHNPPFLISRHKGRPTVKQLSPTGMALGVTEDTIWKQKVIQLHPDDLLLLYTDGITEAQNQSGQFYDKSRLLEYLRNRVSLSAHDVQVGLLSSLQKFTHGLPQHDDIALMVIHRKEEK